LCYDKLSGHLFLEYDVINHGKSAAIVEDFIISLGPSRIGEPEAGRRFEFLHPVLGPGESRTQLRAEPPGDIGF
jgi:hypothetical protein